jgi:calcineurin-like phosphoesterase family protein
MRTLNIRTTDSFNVWFSSDFHLNHQGPKGGIPLWQSRGYKSPEDMTDQIIAKVNELVMPDDYLFYMGDWCLNTTEDKFESDLARINCRNILMLWGNHSNPVRRVYERAIKNSLAGQINGDVRWYDPNQKRGFADTRWMGAVEVYPFRYKNIVFCGDYMEAIVDGQYICMCHYPIEGWNSMGNSSFMIHGHEHSNVKNHLPEGIDGKILDVSWDYFKSPISVQEIEKIMCNKNIRKLGHH